MKWWQKSMKVRSKVKLQPRIGIYILLIDLKTTCFMLVILVFLRYKNDLCSTHIQAENNIKISHTLFAPNQTREAFFGAVLLYM